MEKFDLITNKTVLEIIAEGMIKTEDGEEFMATSRFYIEPANGKGIAVGDTIKCSTDNLTIKSIKITKIESNIFKIVYNCDSKEKELI